MLLLQVPDGAGISETEASLAKLLRFFQSEVDGAMARLTCSRNTRKGFLMVISLPPSVTLHEQIALYENF